MSKDNIRQSLRRIEEEVAGLERTIGINSHGLNIKNLVTAIEAQLDLPDQNVPPPVIDPPLVHTTAHLHSKSGVLEEKREDEQPPVEQNPTGNPTDTPTGEQPPVIQQPHRGSGKNEGRPKSNKNVISASKQAVVKGSETNAAEQSATETAGSSAE